MNDEFLTQYRRTPRRAFADDLFMRLTQERQPAMVTLFVSTPARRFAVGLAALCLIAATVLIAAPGARAAIEQIIRNIGGVNFREMDLAEFPSPPPQEARRRIPTWNMSLAEAPTKLPFPLHLPTWAPDGFELREDYVQYTPPESETGLDHPNRTWLVHLQWGDPTHRKRDSIQLLISHPGTNISYWGVGKGSIEEITLNGKPVAVVHGSPSQDGSTWNFESGLSLYWQQEEDNATYCLWTWTDQFSKVTLEDLIRMAESVR